MSYYGHQQTDSVVVPASALSGEYVTIRMEGQLFAFGLRANCEVVTNPDFVEPPVHYSSHDGQDYLTYFMAHDGQTVTVYDLREWLDFPLAKPGVDTCVLVVRHYGTTYGFVVDGLGQIIRSSFIEQMKSPFELMPGWKAFSDGVYSLFGQPTVVLSPQKLCEAVVNHTAAAGVALI